MNTKMSLLFIGLLATSACATPPSPAELATLPVVTFGETAPSGSDFILYFPAGKDIPTKVEISGDLFQQPAHQVLTVKLKRDIYSYKDWMSYDNQHWLDARATLGMELDIKIPGYTYPQPGHIKLDMFEKIKAP